MLTHKHAFISAAIGAVGWWATGKPLTCAAALAAGTLPDVDHVADYAYYYLTGQHRLILPLHGYEYAVLAGWLAARSQAGTTGRSVVTVAVLSYLIHLLADQMENRTHKLGYSFLFRARHRFKIEAISSMPDAAIRGREADLQLLRRIIR